MLSTVTRRRLLTVAALIGFVALRPPVPASAQSAPRRAAHDKQSAPSRAAHNKQLIQRAFDQWAAGTGNFFDLLADDVQWTITGSSAYSKTYSGKQQFLAEAAAPLTVRLATPIVPTVRNLYADGDVVVAIWDGVATAKDGQPYRNTYCWAMTLKADRITHATAFLDLIPYLDVLRRVPAE